MDRLPPELLDEDLIFHFTKSRIAIEDILFKGKFRFSAMDLMNDPYEYQIKSSGVLKWGRIEDDEFGEATFLLKRTILKDCKIACFVQADKEKQSPFDCPFIKPRSWAQYGDQQYGICLAFSKTKMLSEIENSIKEIELFKGSVQYDLDTENLSQKSSLQINNNETILESIYRHLRINEKDIFFRKYNDFRDENEYRIVLVDKSSQKRTYISVPIHNALKGVILGDRFHEVYKDLIKDLSDKNNASTYSLKYDDFPYVLKI